MTDETGVRLGLAEAALVAVLLASGMLRLDQQVTLAVVALTTVGAGTLLGPLWAGGLGLSAWMMFTGFAENSLGTLSFAERDVVRLGLLVAGCAAVGWVATRDRSVAP
jgi:hypothetical protein